MVRRMWGGSGGGVGGEGGGGGIQASVDMIGINATMNSQGIA